MGRGRAELEGCPRCIQILVLVFNLIFFVFGVAMLAYGIYSMIELGDYVSVSSSDFLTGSKLLIAVGALITVVAFLGCCGAWKLNKCMLIFFIILLSIIFCCEIAAAVVVYLHRNEVRKNLKMDMQDVFNKYGEPGQQGTTKGIDFLQKKEKCCGINEPKDWQKTPWGKNKQRDVPDSCCKTITTDCGKNAIFATGKVDNTKINDDGCVDKVVKVFEKYLPVVGGIAVAIVVIQLLGMIFAGVLLRGVSEGTYA